MYGPGLKPVQVIGEAEHDRKVRDLIDDLDKGAALAKVVYNAASSDLAESFELEAEDVEELAEILKQKVVAAKEKARQIDLSSYTLKHSARLMRVEGKDGHYWMRGAGLVYDVLDGINAETASEVAEQMEKKGIPLTMLPEQDYLEPRYIEPAIVEKAPGQKQKEAGHAA